MELCGQATKSESRECRVMPKVTIDTLGMFGNRCLICFGIQKYFSLVL